MAVNDLIIFRKGTASQWSSANPILASGEPGYDLTNEILKIGDGISNWNGLPPVGGGIGGGLTNLVEDLSPQLGGDLDLNSYDIINNGNININGNITCDYVYSDLSGTLVSANSGNFLNSLKLNGTNVSISGHAHTSSNITDFNSSVSGLLPVKDITAGYDISITDNSNGSYSIASTNLVHVDGKQPHGFVNRTDSEISLSGNIFTIKPTGASYAIYNNGLKIIKTGPESITIPSGTTQINYIHFNSDTTAIDNKTTGFDFTTDLPIAFISWNGSISPSGQMTFFAEERHGINMDARTQQWIHYTFGAQYISGLSIGNYVLGGNGSSNTHATFAISNGTIYQEDIQIDITNTTDINLPFGQELSPIAKIPIYYHEGNTGQWVKGIPNDYAMAYGTNGPKYNLLSGGTWTVENVHSGSATRYFAVWILATNQIDNPVISILGQRVDNTQNAAENNNNWSDVNLTNLPLNEVQILYRLIYAGDADYTNTPKARLMSILDLRTASIVNTVGTPQNDHGSLFGLGDDDHGQYVHIDNARTISAIHTLTNGITFDGSGTQRVPYIPNQVNITGGSGVFSSLKLNSTTVSVSGHSHAIVDVTGLQTALDAKQASGNYAASSHTHIASNITDFNSSVSGLVNGIYAPLAAPTFTGLLTGVSGNFTQSLKVNNINVSTSGHSHIISDVTGLQTSLDSKQPSGNYAASSHTHTASQITDFNTSVSGLLPVKNILAGTNITISSSSGNYTINSSGGGGGSSSTVRGSISTTGVLSSFNVTGGYSVGYLDLFQNGVKLLAGSDFTATNGTSVTLSNSAPSGTVLEYISLGASVTSTNYTKLDSISSSFNGSSTAFGLAVSGIAYYPVSENALGIYVGGVAQEPISSYSISGSNIIFTEAPASGLTFWGVGYGTTAIATLTGIAPGSVSSPAISPSNYLTTGFYFPASGSVSIASSGYDRLKIDNVGNSVFGGQNISGLRYVDINNINSSSTAGSILRLITSNVPGTGNISVDIIKYKNGQFAVNNNETDIAAFTSFNVGSSERLRITSSGNIGIGTTNPTSTLHVIGNSNLAGTLTFNDFTESVVAIGNSSTSKTIALTNGTVQTCTLTANCTFTMPTATAGKSFTLFLSSGAGSFTATFTSVKWSGGTAPVITTTASKTDILSFISDGTFWYGAFSQNY
jgi:hypothetical protein